MEATEGLDPSVDPPRRRTALDPSSGDALKNAAQDAGAAVEQLCRVGTEILGREAQDRPYRVIGIAAGIGFVLGGGLAWTMAGRLINVASRIAVTRALEGWAIAARKELHS